MSDHVTAQMIIYGIIESMHASFEPLMFSNIAHGYYRVSLRQHDYERLQNIAGEIIDEVRLALDQEIKKLNKNSASGLSGLFKGFKGDKNKNRKSYTKPRSGWQICFSIDNGLTDGQRFRIETSIAAPEPTAEAPGDQPPPSQPEDSLSRDTTRTAGAAAETVDTQTAPSSLQVSPNQLAATLDPNAAPKALRAEPEHDQSSIEHIYAQISFTDEHGPQVYQMKKPNIVIGRGGKEYWVDLKLHAASDVSHEHLRLRYEAETGQFFLKDLSTFGTTINGEIMASSLEKRDGVKRDKNIWVELPSEARLGLAGVLFLDFKAMRPS